MSLVRKAVVWLGLNEEYPADETATDHGPQVHPRGERAADLAQRGPHPGPGPSRDEPRPTDQDQFGRPRSQVRPEPSNVSRVQPTPRGMAPEPQSERANQGIRVSPVEQPSSASGSDSTGSSNTHSAVGTVRAIAGPKTTKPQVIIPRSFNDAQQVADAFKDQQPVIVNMQSAERDLARRLIDFSSGLCYGLGGQMERVAEQVYLLTPDDVQVDDEERQRFKS